MGMVDLVMEHVSEEEARCQVGAQSSLAREMAHPQDGEGTKCGSRSREVSTGERW